MKKLSIILGVFLFFGCQKQDLSFEKLKNQEGNNSYNVIYHDSSKIQIIFDQQGNLVTIINKTKLGYQRLHYFPNGMLEAKSFLNFEKKISGRIYYFHEKSGHLISTHQYVNDTLDGYQFDYYDQEGTDSMNMHYVKGKCVGKLLFNKKEEGIGVSGSFIAK